MQPYKSAIFSHIRLYQRIPVILQKQIQGSDVPVFGSYMNRCLTVVSRFVGTGTGLKQHQRASISVLNSRRNVQRRFPQFAPSDVHFGTEPQQRLNDARLSRLNSDVEGSVVILECTKKKYIKSIAEK